jgi:flagellar biosynthesis chaperone FliJ
MSSFRYRLQPLLDQKIQLKEEAAENFSRKQQQLRLANEKLLELRAQEAALATKKDVLRRGLLSSGRGSLSGMDIKRRTEYLTSIGLDLEAAKDAVFAQQLYIDDCARQADEAQRYLAQCTRDAEILVKHRAKQQERFLREAERKEALELDEIGNVMHSRRAQQ